MMYSAGDDSQAIPRHVQDPDSSVQGAEGPSAPDDAQGRTEDHHPEAEGGATAEDGAAGGTVRANHCRYVAEAIRKCMKKRKKDEGN